MSSRVRTVTVAILFGLLGTLSVAVYVNSVRAAIVESGTKKEVFVAAAEVPAGMEIDKAVEEGLLVKEEVPKRYTAEDIITSLEAYRGQVTVVGMSPGEQLTARKMRSKEQSEVAFKLAAGQVAVAIPVDEVTGVGGEIQPGDRVIVVATFQPGPGGVDVSRVLLSGVEVLAGAGAPGGTAAAAQKRTITLGVTAADAEKLVFAEEKGKVWVGLQSPKPGYMPATGGQTMESIYR